MRGRGTVSGRSKAEGEGSRGQGSCLLPPLEVVDARDLQRSRISARGGERGGGRVHPVQGSHMHMSHAMCMHMCMCMCMCM